MTKSCSHERIEGGECADCRLVLETEEPEGEQSE